MDDNTQNLQKVYPSYLKGLLEALIRPLKRENTNEDITEVEEALSTALYDWNTVEELGGLCVEWQPTEGNKNRVQTLIKAGLAREASEFDPQGFPRHFPSVAPFVIDQTESGTIRIYPHRTFIQEAFLAYHVAELANTEPKKAIPEQKDSKNKITTGFQLSKDQEEAIGKSSQRRFSIISGGPGTGKTTSVVRILEELLKENPKALVYVTAPTGKAKSRILKSIDDSLNLQDKTLPLVSECVKENRLLGNTIHMWLFSPTSNGKKPSKKNPLECDILVIDEASMMDSEIAAKLFEAIDPKKTSVIVLGDMHQLAAVGPGSVYADLSDPKGALKDYLSVLKTNHRFDSEKGIGKLAEAINEDSLYTNEDQRIEQVAQILDTESQNGEQVEFIEKPVNRDTGLSKPAEKCLNEHIQRYARKIVTNLLQKGTPSDEDLRDLWNEFSSFRAIAAQRQGPMSVEAINNFCMEKLKAFLGIPASEQDFPGKVLIVRRNDRTLDVANGDDGFIYKPSKEKGWIFYSGSSEVKVPLNLLTDYDIAFAITIHQSQGSGYKEVAVFLPDVSEENAGGLATRELLYTAITRAEEKCIIFGSQESLQKCIQNKTRRTGGLAARLKKYLR